MNINLNLNPNSNVGSGSSGNNLISPNHGKSDGLSSSSKIDFSSEKKQVSGKEAEIAINAIFEMMNKQMPGMQSNINNWV